MGDWQNAAWTDETAPPLTDAQIAAIQLKVMRRYISRVIVPATTPEAKT